VASYRYDPFGNTISSSGSLASANVYRFSSKEYMTRSGIYYYGYRFYDPNLQRWLNRDPIMEAGGLNLYEFALNRPTFAVDPNGRVSIIIPIIIAATAAAIVVIVEGCHVKHCSDATKKLQAAASECKKEQQAACATIEGCIAFIEKYGADDVGGAMYKCTNKKDPGALKDAVEACGKAAVHSYFHGSVPGVGKP